LKLKRKKAVPPGPTGVRVDLHVHSSASRHHKQWLENRLLVESFLDPAKVYSLAKSRGMTHVTITDHNSIEGALRIAGRPDAFVSVEIGTSFPDNRSEIHVIALDITEGQFREIQKVRRSVYDLSRYLRSEGIAHFLAHPLLPERGQLEIDQIERLLLLFGVWEVRNGLRAPELNELTDSLVRVDRPDLLRRLSQKHEIPVAHAGPIGRVGGSDAHAPEEIGRTWTVAPDTKTLPEFLDALREGRTEPAGAHGSYQKLARTIYEVAYEHHRRDSGLLARTTLSVAQDFWRDATRHGPAGKRDLSFAEDFLRRVADLPGRDRDRDRGLSRDRGGATGYVLLARLADRLSGKSFEKTLAEMRDLAEQSGDDPGPLDAYYARHVRRQLLKILLPGRRDLTGKFTSLAAFHVLFLPYLISIHEERREREVSSRVREAILKRPAGRTGPRVAVFSDSITHVDGVALTVGNWMKRFREAGRDVTMISIGPEEDFERDQVRNFQAVGWFPIPVYRDFFLAIPPWFRILHYFERERFDVLHSNTPGPAGLLALLLSKVFGIPLIGSYHTQIPEYTRMLTGDEQLEEIARRYAIWYYDQCETILTPSADTRALLARSGFPNEKMRVHMNGVDAARFTPANRVPGFFERWGVRDRKVILYVGRVSREKSVDFLLECFAILTGRRGDVALVVVGDGPERKELEAVAPHGAVFTGYLSGEDLARAVASADLFVFPSTTDTFGLAVLEALASGVPAVVSDRGGPKEMIRPGETGMVVRANDHGRFLEAIESILDDPDLAARMGTKGRAFAEKHSWEAITAELHGIYLETARRKRRALGPLPAFVR
jgi:glycosyltransferase involved in cell wall biosynthesis